MKAKFGILALLTLWAIPAQADVMSVATDHFRLKHQAQSSLDIEALWQRLTVPSSWWHPEHTYSGSAQNLKLDLKAGGLWQENWENGSVAHGTILAVLTAPDKKVLKLSAPFGPLQALAVTAVWTITLEKTTSGTSVTFDEFVSGSAAAKLDALAPAVDYVKGEAIRRLTATAP